MLDRLDQLESTAVDIVAKIAPWVAPLPTAYLVGRATVLYLRWPPFVGVLAAVIIECLGLASTSTALTLWDYNQSKRKLDPSAPFALAFVLVGVYFVVATGLTVVLDIAPNLATYAPAIFPTLSLTGVTVLAIRADHRRRLVAVMADKNERSQKRSQRRSKIGQGTRQATGQEIATDQAQAVSLDSLTIANQTRKASKEEAMTDLVEFFERNPGASYSVAGQAVDRSKSWVVNAVKDLEAAGRMRRNGNGVEVL